MVTGTGAAFSQADIEGTWTGSANSALFGTFNTTISFDASGNVTGGTTSFGGTFTGGQISINSSTGNLSGTIFISTSGVNTGCTLGTDSKLNATKTTITGSCSGQDQITSISLTGQTAVLTVTKAGSGDGTVTSSPAGISCGSGCNEAYGSGTSVTLIAGPSSGSTFKGWTGACTGTGTCTVTMSADRSVTATYSKNFTDDPITSKVTFAKAKHFLEALEAINTVGQRLGLGTISFTAPIPAAGVPIFRHHMITLQTGLNAIYDALGRTRPTFDAIVPRVTVVGKRQMDQIRNAIRAVESISAN